MTQNKPKCECGEEMREVGQVTVPGFIPTTFKIEEFPSGRFGGGGHGGGAPIMCTKKLSTNALRAKRLK